MLAIPGRHEAGTPSVWGCRTDLARIALQDTVRPRSAKPTRKPGSGSMEVSAAMSAIKRVWIEEGCIVCNACETACPEVFHVTEDSCHIRSASRVDNLENTNLSERSELKPDLRSSLADQIEEAAEGCPVEVIKFERE